MQSAVTQTAAPHSFSGFTASIPGKILLSLAATAIVAAAAHVAIPLPFTPVPFILTPLAVLGVGLAFGPITAFLTLLTYLAEGALGLPVFSPTGPGGIAQLIGPTGGFLMAYPVVAAITSFVTNRLLQLTPRFLAAAIAGSLAIAVLFASGAGWFMHYTHHSLQATLIGAVLPFLPGESVKVLAAAGIYSAITNRKSTTASQA